MDDATARAFKHDRRTVLYVKSMCSTYAKVYMNCVHKLHGQHEIVFIANAALTTCNLDIKMVNMWQLTKNM